MIARLNSPHKDLERGEADRATAIGRPVGGRKAVSPGTSPAQAMFDQSARIQSQLELHRSLNGSRSVTAQAKLAETLSARPLGPAPVQRELADSSYEVIARNPAGGTLTSPGTAQLAKRTTTKKGLASSRRKPPKLTAGGIKKPRATRSRYGMGSHGFKKSEQARLKRLLNISVTGSTHESEHTIGFEPLNRTSGRKRGKAKEAKLLENQAPAYQEVKPSHREHIGTGTTQSPDASGFNSQDYRNAQRLLLEAGDVSSAVQINQLGYAFDPNFRLAASTTEGTAARDSFNKMVENMTKVTYAEGQDTKSVDVDATQRAEMYLSRIAAETGQWPTADQIKYAKEKFGVTSG